MPNIKWNNNLKLVLADVDETVADLYTAATPAMCQELEKILDRGVVLFFVTGQSIKSVQWRIVENIKPQLRCKILVGHCSGAEVWGFDSQGNINVQPFYSLYENALTDEQKKKWRLVVDEVIKDFKLQVYPVMPLTEFSAKAGNNPLAIMLEDRGPQITLEVVNGHDLTPEQAKGLGLNIGGDKGNIDLRVPIIERFNQLLIENALPVTPRLAGVFAVDLALKGVSKTTAIKFVLASEDILNTVGIQQKELGADNIEIWGDKFSVIRGGTDRHMSEALPQEVRSITFRAENPAEFLAGYNIIVWDGQKHLHEGLLEFLQLRP